MDDLDALLLRAQPVRDVDLVGGADEELEALSARYLGGARGAHVPLRRRWRVWVGFCVAVVVASVGGPAAAQWIALRTGDVDSMTHSEMWRMDSPEAPAVLRSFTKDYPLAPGYRTKPMIDQFMQKNAQIPELGARQYVYGWSKCTWELAWLEARAAKDTKSETAAASMLATFPARSQRPVPLFDDLANGYDAQRLAEAVTNNPPLVAEDVAVNCAPVVVQ